LHGRAQAHATARAYYAQRDRLWEEVRAVLDGWRARCDVLVLEGAGSPVELNLREHDFANLRPLRHLDARWWLVGDIDRGGIFAQLAGTWALLEPRDRATCLGAVINRFRGDLSLFSDPQRWLAPHAPGLAVLGTLPWRADLRPDEEDGFAPGDDERGAGETVAWIRFPCVSNLTDAQPWWGDAGVRTVWTSDPGRLAAARAIVLPGSKNTLADLRWLRTTGLADVIVAAARRGVPVVGLCGGYQMLGETLSDPQGVAGDAGEARGLGLLPVRTVFAAEKRVRQITCECDGRRWPTYEIHCGQTEATGPVESLQHVWDDAAAAPRPEGVRVGKVWGTYQHGWFDAPETRRLLAAAAGIVAHRAADTTWAERRESLYGAMADELAARVDLTLLKCYLDL
jgi:adenosylcobyric acid synthase